MTEFTEQPRQVANGRRARFVTFGCKVNQYDTQVLRERALASGYKEVEEDADLIVVNTCTVTEHGGALARKAVPLVCALPVLADQMRPLTMKMSFGVLWPVFIRLPVQSCLPVSASRPFVRPL